MSVPKENDVIFGAICQELGSTAAYDAEVRVRGDGLLNQGAKVSHRALDIMHHDVVSSLQQCLQEKRSHGISSGSMQYRIREVGKLVLCYFIGLLSMPIHLFIVVLLQHPHNELLDVLELVGRILKKESS